MKKILLIGSVLYLASCGSDDKDCNCTQQRWERKVVKNNGDDASVPPISTTEWEKVGNPVSAGSDCSKNGSIPKSGGFDSYPNPGTNTYTVLEMKEVISCQ